MYIGSLYQRDTTSAWRFDEAHTSSSRFKCFKLHTLFEMFLTFQISLEVTKRLQHIIL